MVPISCPPESQIDTPQDLGFPTDCRCCWLTGLGIAVFIRFVYTETTIMRSANDSLGKAGHEPSNKTALTDLLCHGNRVIMEMQHGEMMFLGRELQVVTHN